MHSFNRHAFIMRKKLSKNCEEEEKKMKKENNKYKWQNIIVRRNVLNRGWRSCTFAMASGRRK